MEKYHVYLMFGCGFGVFGFFWGFMRLRRKRIIENIPTSTVRSLAIGLTELVGKAKAPKLLYSPLSNTPCVYYRYKIERYESHGKSSHWVTVAKGDSYNCPFWLDDGTGRILVYPQKAEVILPVDFTFRTGWGTSIPNSITAFMDRSHIRYQSLFGQHTMRFTEWYITEGEPVYVLGTAKITGKAGSSDHKTKLMSRLNELKRNETEMAKLDLNKDGKVSMEEWDIAVKRIEQELIEEQLKMQEEIGDVIMMQGDTEKIFIISDHKQDDLINKLKWEASLGVFGGTVLTLICGFILVKTLFIN